MLEQHSQPAAASVSSRFQSRDGLVDENGEPWQGMGDQVEMYGVVGHQWKTVVTKRLHQPHLCMEPRWQSPVIKVDYAIDRLVIEDGKLKPL
jgi:hypothetical protein